MSFTAERPSIDRTASAAHHTVDTLADQALTGVGKVSGSVHVAVNRTADVMANAAEWVARVPVKLERKKNKLGKRVFETIKARPFATLGGAIIIGMVIGRMARR